MISSNKIVTRFAPSPTGHMHVGSYRTAFFAYLFAKSKDGKFILRIEDTDKNRSKNEYTEEILSVFKKIGISYDELFIQSNNIERHKEILRKLIDEDKAYISREESKDGSGQIKDIIRFRNPNKKVTFIDMIRGEITTDTSDLGDFVIAKNIDEPLFHLAVVIDDHDEGVSHVIRAEEHIANTPRQILIHEALDFNIPQYAHLPIVLGTDKTKLSKRKGAVPVIDYLTLGYLPEALLNAICLCGWNPGTEQEIFTRDELENIFDLKNVQKSGAIFNEEKLNWFNREYIKRLSQEEFLKIAQAWLPENILNNHEKMIQAIEPLMRERINKFSDIQTIFQTGEFDYFFSKPTYSKDMLIWKNLKTDPMGLNKSIEYLNKVKLMLSEIKEEDWKYNNIKSHLSDYLATEGNGNVLWPMRVALSGKEKSPDPFQIAELIGKEETLNRLSI